MPFLDDPTTIEDNAKQRSLDLIKFNIEQTLKYATEQTVVDENIEDLTNNDIYNYIDLLCQNQSIDAEDVRIQSSDITEIELLTNLYNYIGISEVKFPTNYPPRIYFIESGDFAIVFIPTELKKKHVNIFIQPLESTPDFISEIFANMSHEKSIRDIHYVKASDLNPKKKPNT